MKKIIALVAVALISVTAAFAENTFHACVPLTIVTGTGYDETVNGKTVHNDGDDGVGVGFGAGFGDLGFLLGCDADFIYRFNKHFGIYADAGLFFTISTHNGLLVPLKAGVSFTL